MSALKRIFSRNPKGLEETNTDPEDLELGNVPTPSRAQTPLQPKFVRRYPYQRERRHSWSSYNDFAEHPQDNLGDSQYILPATTYQPPLPRSPQLLHELPSPLLPVSTERTVADVRRSVSDSEFSQAEIPVSPDRYHEALQIIEGNSPKTPKKPNHLTLVEVIAHEKQQEAEANQLLQTGENVTNVNSDQDPSSDGPDDLARSSLASNDEAQLTDALPHFHQGFNACGVPVTDLPTSILSSLSTHISNTSQKGGASGQISGTDHLPSGTSMDSSELASTHSGTPFVDLEILRNNLERTSNSNGQSSSISRYSGLVVEDTGFRQMSENEIETELQRTMYSLGEITRSRGRISSLRSTNLDPGSSQASSSSRIIRSPTPPLLYGRNTDLAAAKSKSFEDDWVTDVVDTQTGSSLADNSDSGDPSVVDQHNRTMRHHQAYLILKDNRSTSTMSNPSQDSQGRRLPSSRKYINISQDVPRINNTYRHPVPVFGLSNPFASSPPLIGSKEKSPTNAGPSRLRAHELSQQRISLKSNSTGDFDRLIESFGSINDSRNCQDVFNVRGGVNNIKGQIDTHGEPYPESSAWLSTVDEGVYSNRPSLDFGMGNFSKVTATNGKGNLTGTPDGTGAREVGSSLAGVSSPPDKVSSSPLPHCDVNIKPLKIRPRQQLTCQTSITPKISSSFSSRVYTPQRLRDLSPLASPDESLSLTPFLQFPGRQKMDDQKLSTPDISSIYNTQNKFTSKGRTLNFEGSSKERRRRSSSESNSKVMHSPFASKASALPSPNLRGHKKRNTMDGLLAEYSAFHDGNNENSHHQVTLRERQAHHADTETESASASTASHQSHAILHSSALYTDVAPPDFTHPAYPNTRPWSLPQQERGRAQARSDRIPRPIARVESPHLHRVPREPTAEVLQRQKQISKLWLPIFCIIPPFGLIFSMGYADEIMRTQSGGELDSFTESSKQFAFFWALSATAIISTLAALAVVYGAHV